MLDQKDINSFKENGFVILKNYIDLNLLNSLKDTLYSMFYHNLNKPVKTSTLEELVLKVEKEDHNKVYNIQKAISSSIDAIELIRSLRMDKLHSNLYNSDKKNIHQTLFQSPIQFPNDDRFDFKWHQESGSYPYHSNILTCWFPILGPVNEINGSMTLIPKSHKNGLRKFTHVKKESGLNDWRITLNDGEDKNAEIVKINPTDIVLFDANVIHKSVANTGKNIRVTGIVRAVDSLTSKEVLPLSIDNPNFISKEFTQ